MYVMDVGSNEGQELCYQTAGPSKVFHPLCVGLAALELAKLKDGETGVLTLAQALGDRVLVSSAQRTPAGNLKIKIS